MILIQKGDVYKRIGLDNIDCYSYERLDKNGEMVVTKEYTSDGYPIYNGLGINPPTLLKTWKEIRIG
jgi:hypothetical protein